MSKSFWKLKLTSFFFHSFPLFHALLRHQGLVNNIGFSATDWSTTNTYLMGVFSKAAVRAAMRSDNEFYQVSRMGRAAGVRRRRFPHCRSRRRLSHRPKTSGDGREKLKQGVGR